MNKTVIKPTKQKVTSSSIAVLHLKPPRRGQPFIRGQNGWDHYDVLYSEVPLYTCILTTPSRASQFVCLRLFCFVQVKSTSEKGWSNIQTYLKGSGAQDDAQASDDEEEGVARRGEGEGSHEEDEEDGDVDDLMKHDISDLLGAGREERGAEQDVGGGGEDQPRRSRKKKKSKKSRPPKEEATEPPLISFDDEPIPPSKPAEGSPRPRIKAKSSGSGGYGSTGYGSANSSSSPAKKTEGGGASDWTGDWGIDWGVEDNTAGGNKSSGSKSGGWDEDWHSAGGDGWTTVDLKND